MNPTPRETAAGTRPAWVDPFGSESTRSGAVDEPWRSSSRRPHPSGSLAGPVRAAVTVCALYVICRLLQGAPLMNDLRTAASRPARRRTSAASLPATGNALRWPLAAGAGGLLIAGAAVTGVSGRRRVQ